MWCNHHTAIGYMYAHDWISHQRYSSYCRGGLGLRLGYAVFQLQASANKKFQLRLSCRELESDIQIFLWVLSMLKSGWWDKSFEEWFWDVIFYPSHFGTCRRKCLKPSFMTRGAIPQTLQNFVQPPLLFLTWRPNCSTTQSEAVSGCILSADDHF